MVVINLTVEGGRPLCVHNVPHRHTAMDTLHDQTGVVVTLSLSTVTLVFILATVLRVEGLRRTGAQARNTTDGQRATQVPPTEAAGQ